MKRTLGQRSYILVAAEDVPPRPDALLFFHGSLQSGSVVRRFTANTFDHLFPLVVYPNGYDRHFNDARAVLPVKAREEGIDDVGFTRDLGAQLRADYGVGRVFAAGFSNGGQMVLRLLFDAPGLLSGAAVFASALGAGDNHAPSNPDSAYVPTPVMFIHGTEDPLAPYAGGTSPTRGAMLGARANAQRFAQLNGAGPGHDTVRYPDTTVTRWEGANPVELWTVAGMGHVVPAGNTLDPRLGANTDSFLAADAVRGFFDYCAARR